MGSSILSFREAINENGPLKEFNELSPFWVDVLSGDYGVLSCSRILGNGKTTALIAGFLYDIYKVIEDRSLLGTFPSDCVIQFPIISEEFHTDTIFSKIKSVEYLQNKIEKKSSKFNLILEEEKIVISYSNGSHYDMYGNKGYNPAYSLYISGGEALKSSFHLIRSRKVFPGGHVYLDCPVGGSGDDLKDFVVARPRVWEVKPQNFCGEFVSVSFAGLQCDIPVEMKELFERDKYSFFRDILGVQL